MGYTGRATESPVRVMSDVGTVSILDFPNLLCGLDVSYDTCCSRFIQIEAMGEEEETLEVVIAVQYEDYSATCRLR